MPDLPEDAPQAPAPAAPPAAAPAAATPCPRCRKPDDLCVCAGLDALPTRLKVLVLQHPQEQDVDLGTAHLLALQLAEARVKVGLSWPNLAKALGDMAGSGGGEGAGPDPARWAVLYMGPGDDVAATPRGGWRLLDRKGTALDGAALDTATAGLDGLILLDGSWSQAKALWWRNAWLLKLRRLVIHPDFVSAYGPLRKEPRRESVSTLEAAAFALAKLEGDESLLPRLTAPFHALVARYKAVRGDRPPSAPRGRPFRGKPGAGKGNGASRGGWRRS